MRNMFQRKQSQHDDVNVSLPHLQHKSETKISFPVNDVLSGKYSVAMDAIIAYLKLEHPSAIAWKDKTDLYIVLSQRGKVGSHLRDETDKMLKNIPLSEARFNIERTLILTNFDIKRGDYTVQFVRDGGVGTYQDMTILPYDIASVINHDFKERFDHGIQQNVLLQEEVVV